jgi:hypothetical protein
MEIFVDEDVAGLDITVQDLARMKIGQRTSHLHGDIEAGWPCEEGHLTAAVEMVSEGAIRDELIGEEEVAAAAAVGGGVAAIERDQVGVAQPREDIHLVFELLHTLVTVLVQALYRHHAAVPENPCQNTHRYDIIITIIFLWTMMNRLMLVVWARWMAAF